MTSATEQWRDELAAWAIPPEILQAAPEPPWGFPVELFTAQAAAGRSVSADRALAAMGSGGDVLDVGCGGGAASIALVPPAKIITGVDSSPDMLAAFAAAALNAGVAHREIEGAWPTAASSVDPHDVVVCHHVFYNVPELPEFALALTAKARRRVVIELTAVHPLVATAPLWRHFHGIDRPRGPSAELAVEVLTDAGLHVSQQRWQRPARDVPRQVMVTLNRRRLCLPATSEPEVDRLMGEADLPRDVVTLWWDTRTA